MVGCSIKQKINCKFSTGGAPSAVETARFDRMLLEENHKWTFNFICYNFEEVLK